MKRSSGHNYNKSLVAASIGSYGAYLADGSEYRFCHNNRFEDIPYKIDRIFGVTDSCLSFVSVGIMDRT